MKARLMVENPIRAKKRRADGDRRKIQMMCSKALTTVCRRGKQHQWFYRPASRDEVDNKWIRLDWIGLRLER
jgi:hypothetical protein